jgi:hypothetical protein
LALFAKKEEIGSTQEALKFAEIRDGIVVLKDGNLRQILLCSSINFSLKSEMEQTALIFAYQNFLNSLTFPVQILMQSKKLDLSNYLAMLEKKAAGQTNELLRLQTKDYTDFIKRLINLANIMDKRFYTVIPFLIPPKINASPMGKSASQPILSEEEFNQYKKELEQRVEVVQSGLGSIGIRTVLLDTQQIIELLYSVYNLEEANKEKIPEAGELQSEIVESAVLKPEVKNESAPDST